MSHRNTDDKEVFLSFDFIEKYVKYARPEYIQLFIYIKYCYEKDGFVPKTSDIARALGMTDAGAEFILDYWQSRGEIVIENNNVTFAKRKERVSAIGESSARYKDAEGRRHAAEHIRSVKPSYSQSEICNAAASNKQISGLFYQAETILNKALTESETELLFSFNDWLGLPVEVITMLLSYAAKKGKTTKRYLETVAIDWVDKGIDTFEAAEAYITELEAADSAEKQVRSILGIYDRGLTTTERKYIKIWVNEMKIPSDLIALAYDKTVEYTGKLSWGYMDKMLQSWIANGYATKDEVKAADQEFKSKNAVVDKKATKSKFANYDAQDPTDYKKLEEDILDMILDDDI